MKHLSSLLTLLAFLGFIYVIYITPEDPDDTFTGRVTWVSDGDTFKMTGHDWPIRVWGIDAPERDNAGGQASRDYVTRLIKGKTVSCEKIVVDRYKRIVATCFLGGKDIAETILSNGHATEYCSFSRGHYGRC